MNVRFWYTYSTGMYNKKEITKVELQEQRAYFSISFENNFFDLNSLMVLASLSEI